MNAVVTPHYPRWAAGLKPLLLLVGIAAAVAAGVSVVLWSRGPSYSLLYANLGTEDQAQITQSLDSAGIPYRLTPGSNAIEVPTERVSDARLKLAGQGLPEGDGGFSLLTKDPGLGVSQFIETARYQHALEVELAHTIASLRPVDGARVHIAASADSAFVRDRRPASASVFVQLKSGRALSQEQVQAIVNLVASSVPNLEASQVTVVDQQGRLLSAPQGTDELALRDGHFELVRQIEDDYVQRIEGLLAPLVGSGRVRAQVVAELNTAVTEEAREQYQPGSQIVRSEQLSEQSSHDGSASGGVPGALTNQPPPAGIAQPPPAQRTAAGGARGATASAGAAGAAGSTGSTGAGGAARPGASSPPADAAAAESSPANVSKESTRNYEIDRTLDYTRQPAGGVKRLTVAVLLDNVRTIDKDGKPHERPLSQSELDHVTQLVKDAVGFDAKRGDSVNVFNSSFQSDAQPADGPLEHVPLWQQPIATELAKLAAGLIVLVVLSLAVLRPLVRGLIGPARAALSAPPSRAAVEAAAEATAAAPASSAVVPQRFDQQVTNARALVNQDPKRVAQVVRTWVAADE
ncbi:MAG TPA: flagellar basal-body MS-ring/collar protein FliF [Steroidobacteraceae bacterium]|nr:flagellar basal-body MS-ring/collar protein FliF [Steroidobacteraceae bacterium]